MTTRDALAIFVAVVGLAFSVWGIVFFKRWDAEEKEWRDKYETDQR